MSKLFAEYQDDPDAMLALPPEVVAELLLGDLKDAEKRTRRPETNRGNFVQPFAGRDDGMMMVLEAWSYLEREGLIAPWKDNLFRVTRRGWTIGQEISWEAYRRSRAIVSRDALHPDTAHRAWTLFVQGDYETAVFKAFKGVEVAVRAEAGYSNSDVGVSLMRKAFKPRMGPLADTTTLEGEQQAVADLFAGAIGSYRNPVSHRDVPIDSPEEAAEIVSLASHLMRIVDAASARSNP